MHRVRIWLLWGIVLVVITVAMRLVRGELDQAQVALTYVLIVLGGTATGGRNLGLALSGCGFVLVDYFFQQPYDTLSVDKPLDWLVLIAFLATAAVATQLLTRAQAEADRARRRADEVKWLSQLGSETLTAGRADDALAAIAGVIHRTLHVRECEIHAWHSDTLRVAAIARTDGAPAIPVDPALIRRVAERGQTVAVRTDGTVAGADNRAPHTDVIAVDTDDVMMLLLPLRVHTRLVGVLRITNDTPLALDAAQRSFLSALAYYAALGVERARLVAEVEHAEALREASRLKDIFIASVSHDLRTPLTTIKALAQGAAMRGDQAAAVIEEQADRLSRFVDDLLDLSRIRSGGVTVHPEINAAEDLVGAAVRQMTGLLNGRTLTKSIDLDQPALFGRFDFVQSLRILTNLIENALRYTPAGSAVELGVRREGDVLMFSVADRGPGVPAVERERIFEPFYRPTSAPPDAGRLGLGLSIARRLAEAQGGSLRYEDRAGGGSRFILSLPAADVDDAAREEILANY